MAGPIVEAWVATRGQHGLIVAHLPAAKLAIVSSPAMAHVALHAHPKLIGEPPLYSTLLPVAPPEEPRVVDALDLLTTLAWGGDPRG